MGGCKTWCSANRRRGGRGASWWTWCIANVEWVKVGECEVMKASGEGCSRPETNLMGKIAAECKMMGLLRVQKCSKRTKGVSNCMAGQSTKVQSTKVPMDEEPRQKNAKCKPQCPSAPKSVSWCSGWTLKCKKNFWWKDVGDWWSDKGKFCGMVSCCYNSNGWILSIGTFLLKTEQIMPKKVQLRC